MKKIITVCLTTILILLSTGCFEAKIVPEKKTLLEGTINATDMFVIDTKIPGKTIFIVGGVHGIEEAGWKAALQLVQKKYKQGKIYIIPQANIVAAQLMQRYPNVIETEECATIPYQGQIYCDLNRSFPGKSDGTVTERIADAIIQEIILSNADFVIELHESQESYDVDPKHVGNTVIMHRSREVDNYYETVDNVKLLVNEFNEKYILKDEKTFKFFDGPPSGSLNHYSTEFLKKQSITIETVRKTGSNCSPYACLSLDRRIEQQIQMVDLYIDILNRE